jgi:hypothetical protein
MSEQNFSHLVEIDESTRSLRIHRVFPDGRRHLLTETPLPACAAVPKGSQYEEFARQLGENLLLDSPAARRILGL